uniref:Uncharacterized protein n=1 Tax=viral metagenome TaxID=1070528 RepID=A0A6M3IQK2_9ZZZZ
MKYKVTNLLEQEVKCGKLLFKPKETKILDKIPGEGFHIEKIETEKKIKLEDK